MLVLLIGGIVGLIIAATIALTWGILVLIGIILITTGALIIILNRGKTPDNIFIFAIIIGVVFIMLSMTGFELGTVSFENTPLEQVFRHFNS